VFSVVGSFLEGIPTGKCIIFNKELQIEKQGIATLKLKYVKSIRQMLSTGQVKEK